MILNFEWEQYAIPGTDATVEVKPLNIHNYQRCLKFLSKSDFFKHVQQLPQIHTGNAESIESSEGEIPIQNRWINPEIILEQFTNEELGNLIRQVLPSQCRNLMGVQKRVDGKLMDATLEECLEHAAFFTHGFSVLMHLFTRSQLTKSEQDALKKT